MALSISIVVSIFSKMVLSILIAIFSRLFLSISISISIFFKSVDIYQQSIFHIDISNRASHHADVSDGQPLEFMRRQIYLGNLRYFDKIGN